MATIFRLVRIRIAVVPYLFSRFLPCHKRIVIASPIRLREKGID